MNYEQTLKEIEKYLSNDVPYSRIPDTVQWHCFKRGIYMVESKGFNVRFSPKFQAFLDDNNLFNVFLTSVTDNIYVIYVREEK